MGIFENQVCILNEVESLYCSLTTSTDLGCEIFLCGCARLPESHQDIDIVDLVSTSGTSISRRCSSSETSWTDSGLECSLIDLTPYKTGGTPDATPAKQYTVQPLISSSNSAGSESNKASIAYHPYMHIASERSSPGLPPASNSIGKQP